MSWRWLAALVIAFTAFGLSKRQPTKKLYAVTAVMVIIVIGYKAIRLHTL